MGTVTTYNGTSERQVLIALITSGNICARVADKIQKDSFNNPAADLVAKWSIAYYQHYSEPIRENIEVKFEKWAETSKNKNLVEDVENILVDLSEEYENDIQNDQFVLDEIDKFLKDTALIRLTEEIKNDCSDQDYTTALSRISTFQTVDVSESSGVDLFHDSSAIEEAFNTTSESLITMPGELGSTLFFGDNLCRDAFVSLIAPEKRGKSFWLIDLAWRAVLQSRKVAFFSVGDMSQNQVIMRFSQRAANRPYKPKTIKYPVSMEMPEEKGDLPKMKWEPREFSDYLEPAEAVKRMKRILKKKVRGNKNPLKISSHPASTLSVAGMRSILQNWARQGWVADVVVIDYADILAPPSGIADTRDQINMTWKKLRALSQEFHNLVITATQADANSYGSRLIRRQNFSEDKRKLAHVTFMMGLNQTEEEKEIGVYRLNTIASREEFYSENYEVYTASCLDVCKPAILNARG
jgi:replicative DNA helicase